MPSPRTPSRSERRAGWAHTLLGVLALASSVAGPAAPARAAEVDSTEQAREHHRAADSAFKAGRYDEAFREWELGYKLSGRPLFLLNMAHAERRRGELRGARALYKRYLVMEPQTKLRAEVEEVLAQIEGALAAEEAAARPGSTPAPQERAATTSILPAAGAPAPLLEPGGAPPNLLASEPSPALPAKPPFYKKWWFWTGAGAALALGAVTGALLLRGDSYTRSGSLGTVGAPP